MRNDMLKLLTSIALMGSLLGCQKQTPSITGSSVPINAGIKPSSIKVNDGIEHEFYRDVSFEVLLKQLPSGSVDALDLNLDIPSPVFALVKVPDQPALDLAKVRFETQFKTQDGQVIQKRWAAAKDRQSGKGIALFCLPATVVEGETKILQTGD
jgi:hypothetical protein